MNTRLLTIGISRIDRFRKAIDRDSLPSNRQDFYDSLSCFVDSFLSKDLTVLSVDEMKVLRNDIELISAWFSLLPYDGNHKEEFKPIYSLLECLAKKWIDTYDEYIMLVSQGPYAFANYGRTKDLKIEISKLEARNSSILSHIPVLLVIPEQLRSDVFLGVALLHEVGHFYDFTKGIQKSVYEEYTDMLKGSIISVDDFTKSFPNSLKPLGPTPSRGIKITISKTDPSGKTTDEDFEIDERYCLLHVGEFIADLFGAQYVGMHIFQNVDYHCSNPDSDHYTHPSDSMRKQMVDDFIKNTTTNNLLNCISKNFGDKEKALKIRFKSITDDPHMVGDQIVINNDDELFAIQNRAWNLYEEGPDKMKSKKKDGKSLSLFELYTALNNDFIESINAYFTKA